MVDEVGRRVFVVCGRSARAADLEALFSRFGALAPGSPRVLLERGTGAPRGAAYVTFVDGAGARAAIAALHGREAALGDEPPRKLKVLLAEPREAAAAGQAQAAAQAAQVAPMAPAAQAGAAPPDTSAGLASSSELCDVLVAEHPDNVPPRSRVFAVVPKAAGEEELRAAFAALGAAQGGRALQGVTLVRDRHGESKGACYAKFTTAAAAAAAIDETMMANSGRLGDHSVTLKLAEPRAAKTSASQSQGSAPGGGSSGVSSGGKRAHGGNTGGNGGARRGKRAHRPSLSRSVESGAGHGATRLRTESSSDTATSKARHEQAGGGTPASAQQAPALGAMADAQRAIVAALGDSFAQVMGVGDAAQVAQAAVSPLGRSSGGSAPPLPPAAMAALASQLLRDAGMTSAAAVAAAAAAEAATADYHGLAYSSAQQQAHTMAYSSLHAHAQALQAQVATQQAQMAAQQAQQHAQAQAQAQAQAAQAALAAQAPQAAQHAVAMQANVRAPLMPQAQAAAHGKTRVTVGSSPAQTTADVSASPAATETPTSQAVGAVAGAQDAAPSVDERRLYVTWEHALHSELDAADAERALRSAFERFGEVSSLRVGRHKSGAVAYAHIAFGDHETAAAALRALNESEPIARMGALRVQVADPGHGRRSKRQRVDGPKGKASAALACVAEDDAVSGGPGAS